MKTFTLAGYLGADPELKAKDDTTWTNLRIACNDGKNTDWFWVTAFGKLAEIVVEHLGKGSGLAVQGRLRVNRYQDKERVELIAQDVQFFSRRSSEPQPDPEDEIQF